MLKIILQDHEKHISALTIRKKTAEFILAKSNCFDVKSQTHTGMKYFTFPHGQFYKLENFVLHSHGEHIVQTLQPNCEGTSAGESIWV